jgi:hypothetical protein
MDGVRVRIRITVKVRLERLTNPVGSVLSEYQTVTSSHPSTSLSGPILDRTARTVTVGREMNPCNVAARSAVECSTNTDCSTSTSTLASGVVMPHFASAAAAAAAASAVVVVVVVVATSVAAVPEKAIEVEEVEVEVKVEEVEVGVKVEVEVEVKVEGGLDNLATPSAVTTASILLRMSFNPPSSIDAVVGNHLISLALHVGLRSRLGSGLG